MRKWIDSGQIIEAEEYFAIRTPKSIKWPEIGKKPLRSKNRYITTEEQKKLNNRNAVKHLERLVTGNFKPPDFFLTLDLREIPLLPNGEPDEETVKKLIEKFYRKLRKIYLKAKVEFKYIWVIEKATLDGPKRIHAHMLIPKFSLDAIAACWTFGGCTIRRLDISDDFKELADYLSKDPTLGMNHKKRWGGSKNLIQPKISCKKIQYPGGPIKPPKGYKEIIDRAYWSDITGLIRYVRYIRIDGFDIAGRILKDTGTGLDQISSG
jgi:hypothetical protein